MDVNNAIRNKTDTIGFLLIITNIPNTIDNEDAIVATISGRLPVNNSFNKNKFIIRMKICTLLGNKITVSLLIIIGTVVSYHDILIVMTCEFLYKKYVRFSETLFTN